jgi:hypothetical protein
MCEFVKGILDATSCFRSLPKHSFTLERGLSCSLPGKSANRRQKGFIRPSASDPVAAVASAASPPVAKE